MEELRKQGKDPFKITKCDVTHHSMEIKNNYDELEKVIINSLTDMCLNYINKDKIKNDEKDISFLNYCINQEDLNKMSKF